MSGARAWFRRHQWPLITGALAGLLIATTLAFTWQRAQAASAVTLLGSGHGLSAIVSSGSMRVLIVSGDDPIAFANAFADARPPTMRRIDIVILTPNVSPLLAEQAVELTSPTRIMAISSLEAPDDEPALSDPVRAISAPRSIELGRDLLIDIDPGLVAGQPGTGWIIRVESGDAAILLAELVPHRPAPNVGLVAIMGDEVPSAATALAIPTVHSTDAMIPVGSDSGQIAPGESARIPIDQHGIRIPLGWLRAARS